jgi:ABC-type sugar transport system ATPase subunit
MAQVELDRVSVLIEGSRRLDDVSLVVPDGEFVGLVGESGSGKTSLLRAIAGLDRVTAGTVRIGGVDVTAVSPGDRDVGLMFQDPALFEHLSVGRNVAFPLEIRHLGSGEIHDRVGAEMRAWDIETLARRHPAALSRGEQQIVQIARTLVRVPKVLLLDEPFVAVDEPRRGRLRHEIALLQQGYGVTTLMSTNDPADVTALASTLVVLAAGRVVQVDRTSAVRRSPATLVAAMATGPIATLEMRVVADSGGFWLVRHHPAAGESVRLRAWTPALVSYVGAAVTVGVRPEEVVIVDTGAITATVERAVVLHPGWYECLVAGQRVIARAQPGLTPSPGDRVQLRIDHHVAFDPRTGMGVTSGVRPQM